jgi:hypothetical protein
MLPTKYYCGDVWSPPQPLIFHWWENTTDDEKMFHLKIHILYAAEKYIPDRVEEFIKELT